MNISADEVTSVYVYVCVCIIYIYKYIYNIYIYINIYKYIYINIYVDELMKQWWMVAQLETALRYDTT